MSRKGTHNVKFFAEKIDKKAIVPYMHAWQRHGKHVGLQRPVRAVAGHAAHGKREQHHGKAEVIWN